MEMNVVWRSWSCPAANKCFEVSHVGAIAEMNLAAYKHLGWASLPSLPYFFSYLNEYCRSLLPRYIYMASHPKDKQLIYYRAHNPKRTTSTNPKDNPEDKPGDTKKLSAFPKQT